MKARLARKIYKRFEHEHEKDAYYPYTRNQLEKACSVLDKLPF